jgi:hypothetical protein
VGFTTTSEVLTQSSCGSHACLEPNINLEQNMDNKLLHENSADPDFDKDTVNLDIISTFCFILRLRHLPIMVVLGEKIRFKISEGICMMVFAITT